jgi:hypothetical protein
MGHDHRLLDAATWLSAGVAAISLASAALWLTVIATAISIALGVIRLHDRFRYGPPGRGR